MKIEIEENILLDLIHWSRRYCDKRATYAPSEFNRIYDTIKACHPEIIQKDQFDYTLSNNGEFWPYAQDGQYNSKTGSYDARPMQYLRKIDE